MIVKMNNIVIKQDTIEDTIKKEIVISEGLIGNLSRETRRGKAAKIMSSTLAAIGTVVIATTAHADPIEAPQEAPRNVYDIVADIIERKITEKLPEQLGRDDSIMWKLNDYMSDVLFKSYDFFTNPTILDLYHSISVITLSFTALIIAKKGFDMIRAKMLGASTLGLPELIIRLLCSLVIMFISLKVGSLGIAMSNAVIQSFFGSVMNGFVPTSTVALGLIGTFFWVSIYILLFIVLGVRYWIRQINMVFIGLMAPVASLSWVTDGGAMLGSLIKEFTVHLTTPIAQGAVLAIGTIIMTEVASMMLGFGGAVSQILIGISTLFVAIFTPDTLKKFIQGSANPFSFAMKTAMQLKSFPSAMKALIK